MYKIKQNGTKVEVEMTIPAKEWEEGVEKIYEKEKGRFDVIGFRKGHAPRKVIEKAYGDNVFFEDTVNYFLEKTLGEVLYENSKLEPVDRPTTQFESYTLKDGLKMKIMFEIVPDFKLPQYKGLEIEVHEATVTEEEIDAHINNLLNDNAKFEPVDRPIKNGDSVLIDFMGFINDVEFEGGTSKGYSLEIGSHSFIDNFEEQLIGHKAGESVDVNVTFPKDYYAEEYQGQKALFKVDIHEVREKHLPELTDKFIADTTEYETIEEYRKGTYAHIQTMKENQQEVEFDRNVRDAIIDNTEIEIPESMIDSNVNYEIGNIKASLEAYKISLEDYVKYFGCDTIEEYSEKLRDRVTRNIKFRYIVRKVVEENNLEVSQQEVEEATKDIQDEREKIVKENGLLLDKFNKFLRENNKIKLVKD